jgi:ribosome recycling factor
MRHLGANMYSRYHNKPLVKRFKGLCLQNHLSKFNQIRRELDDTTRKMMDDQQMNKDRLRSQMVEGQTVTY